MGSPKRQQSTNRPLQQLLISLACGWLSLGSVTAGAVPEADARLVLQTVHDRIVEVHPEPFHATSERELGRLLLRQQRSIRGEVEPEAIWLAANPLVAAISDAHTSLSFNEEDAWLPVRFVWAEDGLGVAEVGDGVELTVGARVLKLGGRTPDQLLASMVERIPAENEHWVRRAAPRYLASRSRLADVARVRETVELVTDQGTVNLSFSERPIMPVQIGEPAYWWKVIPEINSGYFRLSTCPKPTAAYERNVDGFFHEVAVRDLTSVIVDVRGNTGGNSAVIDALLDHLPADDLPYYGGSRRLSVHAIEQRKLDPEQFDMMPGSDLTVVMQNRYVKDRHMRRLTPFTGEVLVLTDSGTFSSGNWVATVLTDNRLATVIGRPTGNAPSSYGDILSFDVGYGLDLTVSYTRWIRPDPTRDPADSLHPDVHVPFLLDEVTSGSDPIWEWVNAHLGGDAPVPSPPQGLRPTVTMVSPVSGSVGVDTAMTELVVTFSEPMSRASHSLVRSNEAFPKPNGDTEWRDEVTFVIPVTLEAGRHYEIGVNSPRYDGFRAVDGTPAESFIWVFDTRE